jgi:long-chain acyl-CoA synthetase
VDDVAVRLRRTATAAPERTALVWDGGRRTYGELHDRAEAGAAALRALGTSPGERIAIVLGTTPAFVEVVAAALRAGAVVVPLLPGLAPDELRYAIADSGATVAVVGPERLTDVHGLRGELPELRHLVAADLGGDALPEGVEDWDALRTAAEGPGALERGQDDLAALVYTSGTTGRPRGAMLTRGNLAANQDQSLAGRFHVGADDVVLLVLPLAHIYAFNVGLGASLAAGATMVLVERFDPVETLEVIQREGVTVLLGAPPMYVAWLQAGLVTPHAFAGVRLAVSGAAPLPVHVFEQVREHAGVTIEEGYGLTEAGPSVASSAMGPEARPGSVGLPLPGIELRLVGDDGEDVEPGDPGEIHIRGPNVFRGYWNDPDATARALTEDGWLRTGDIGTQDDDGYLYLIDRRRDLILVNGFNVYPREVERVLLTDPAVAQAGVVGAPHPLSGETVVASVVAATGATVDVEALAASCRHQLARYKCPSRIEVVDTLPTTATGKLRRGALRGEDDTDVTSA